MARFVCLLALALVAAASADDTPLLRLLNQQIQDVLLPKLNGGKLNQEVRSANLDPLAVAVDTADLQLLDVKGLSSAHIDAMKVTQLSLGDSETLAHITVDLSCPEDISATVTAGSSSETAFKAFFSGVQAKGVELLATLDLTKMEVAKVELQSLRISYEKMTVPDSATVPAQFAERENIAETISTNVAGIVQKELDFLHGAKLGSLGMDSEEVYP